MNSSTNSVFVKLNVAIRNELREMRGARISVYLALGTRVNGERESWPSLEQICKETGYGKRAVLKALAWLEEKGYIKREHQGGHRPNKYRVNHHFIFGRGAPTEPSTKNRGAKTDIPEVNCQQLEEEPLEEEPRTIFLVTDVTKNMGKNEFLPATLATKNEKGDAPGTQLPSPPLQGELPGIKIEAPDNKARKKSKDKPKEEAHQKAVKAMCEIEEYEGCKIISRDRAIHDLRKLFRVYKEVEVNEVLQCYSEQEDGYWGRLDINGRISKLSGIFPLWKANYEASRPPPEPTEEEKRMEEALNKARHLRLWALWKVYRGELTFDELGKADNKNANEVEAEIQRIAQMILEHGEEKARLLLRDEYEAAKNTRQR